MLSDDVATDTVRREIEDDIQRHAQAIVDLKRRLNALTRVVRLPTEVLSEVFLHLARDDYENYHKMQYSYFSGQPPSWITVAHICHAWREVALNSPRLWGYLSLNRARPVTDFLLRSKNAPLWITATLLTSDIARFKVLEGILQAETHRIMELRLIGPGRILLDACQKLSQYSPNLTSLVLSDTTSLQMPMLDTPSIPTTLLSQSLPRLRSVDIRHFIIPWNHPLLTANLTSLIIHGRASAQALIGSFETLLSVLEATSDLQLLDLEETIPPLPMPDNTESLPPPSRKVKLPSLRELSLSATFTECANLLNHITIPADARLRIVGRCAKASRESLVEIVKEHLTRSLPLKTLRLDHILFYDYKQVLSGWRKLVEPDLVAPEDDVRLESPTLTIAELTTNTNAFAHVQRLDIGAKFSTSEWKTLFLGLPNVRVLSTRGDLTQAFTEALTYVVGGETPQPTMVLSSLEVLKLREIRLLSPQGDAEVEFVDELIDCLIERCNYGIPVQELHLSRCINTVADDLNELKEIVPDVQWDGIQDLETDDEEEEDEEDWYSEEAYTDDLDYHDHDYGFDEDDLFGFGDF